MRTIPSNLPKAYGVDGGPVIVNKRIPLYSLEENTSIPDPKVQNMILQPNLLEWGPSCL